MRQCIYDEKQSTHAIKIHIDNVIVNNKQRQLIGLFLRNKNFPMLQ